METNREKFTRLHNSRLPKALRAIDLLANLAKPSSYEYTAEEAQALVKNLRGRVEHLAHLFGQNSDLNKPNKFDVGYALACCNLVNLHDLLEIAANMLIEGGVEVANIKTLGLSEYDMNALTAMEDACPVLFKKENNS